MEVEAAREWRWAGSGAFLMLAVPVIVLVVSPQTPDQFVTVKWYALQTVAAIWLATERFLHRSHGLPRFVVRTWPACVTLVALVAAGGLRHGAAWAMGPFLARTSFLAVALAAFWHFRRTELRLGQLRCSIALTAGLIVPVGLAQMAGMRPLYWLTSGDHLSATFGNVNMAAQFVGLSLVVVLAAGASGRPGRGLVLELLGGGSLAYVFLGGSRSVLLALAVALPLLAVFRRLTIWRLSRMGLLAAVLVAIVLRLSPGGADPLGPNGHASKDVSARMRLAVWNDTLNLLKDHPLGVGAGNFEHAFIPYSLAGRSRSGEKLIYRSPHNEYLRLLAEEGVAGALLLFALLFLLARDLNRSPAIDSWRSGAGTLLASCGAFLGVEAFFQFPFELAYPAWLSAVLLGLALAAVEPRYAAPGQRRIRLAMGVFDGTCVLASWLLLIGTMRMATAERLFATRRGDLPSLERACRIDPRRIEACVEAAWQHSRARDHRAARRILGVTLGRSPSYLPARKLLAEDLLAAGDREEGCRQARAYDVSLGGASSLSEVTTETCEAAQRPAP